MKKYILIIIALIPLLGVQAQIKEYIRIYSDKECYLAGEDLWVKVCVTDSLYRESTISQVAYVEIDDTRQIHAQGKISLRNGIGWGRIKCPRTMHSGTYRLTAYTRYLQNFPVSSFPKKYVAILNVNQTAEEDNVELRDSIPMVPDPLVNSSLHLYTDKPVYTKRSKVELLLPQLPGDVKDLTVSVVRKDCALSAFPFVDHRSISLNRMAGEPFIAECEGHIVSGKLEGISVDSVNARLACVGRDIRIFEGQPQPDNTFRFYTSGVTDIQNIVITTLSEKKHSERIEIVPPFAGVLPEQLPKLYLACNEKTLIERNIGVQLGHIIALSNRPNESALKQLHDFSPSVSYNLDEYVRFSTVRETFMEFILEVRAENRNDEYFITVMHDNKKYFSTTRALVLLDGVPIDNHEAVLNYDARLLHYIQQYSGRYTFGGEVYDGIVSLLTHKGTLPAMRLDECSQLFSYEFPQNRPTFVTPMYHTETEKNSRIPDFRHTLYWNPEISSKGDTVSFYTSDMRGTYIATLQGLSLDGRIVKAQCEFLVE